MVESLKPHGQEGEEIDNFDKALDRIVVLEVENQRLYRHLHKVLMLRIEIRKGETALTERDDKLIRELQALFQKGEPLKQLPEVTQTAEMPPVEEPKEE